MSPFSFKVSEINPISFEAPPKADSRIQVEYLPKTDCKPKQNVLFVKSHKRGYSYVQNLFFHYGRTHNLTFLSSRRGEYSDYRRTSNSRMPHLDPRLAQRNHSWSSIRNDTFAPRLKYNYEKIKSIMPDDTVLVTILTDSMVLTESRVASYFPKKDDYEKFASRLEKIFSAPVAAPEYHASLQRGIYDGLGPNQISYRLGLDAQHFNNIDMITNFINTIDSQFHLVMLTDRMDESLIHLQHLLCWTSDDMLLFQHNLRNKTSENSMSIELKEKIRSFNKADELLYKHFDAKLTSKTEALGKKEIEKQIISLQDARKLMQDKCIGYDVPVQDLESPKRQFSNHQVPRFKLKDNTDRQCRDFLNYPQLYDDVLGFYNNNTNSKV